MKNLIATTIAAITLATASSATVLECNQAFYVDIQEDAMVIHNKPERIGTEDKKAYARFQYHDTESFIEYGKQGGEDLTGVEIIAHGVFNKTETHYIGSLMYTGIVLDQYFHLSRSFIIDRNTGKAVEKNTHVESSGGEHSSYSSEDSYSCKVYNPGSTTLFQKGTTMTTKEDIERLIKEKEGKVEYVELVHEFNEKLGEIL